jgi:serine/threonine-protein kinase
VIAFNCPLCGKALEVADNLARNRVACPFCRRAISVPSSILPAGTVVGGYRIEAHIGSGGFGDVYRATQLSVDRRVALKILSPEVTKDPESVASFLREARILAKLDHPNVVTVFDAGEEGGVHYLATSFVEGEDLATRIARKGALPEREALKIAQKVAETLGDIWERHSVLHNDVTPANIMIDPSGDVRLLDVGLSLHLQPGKRVAKAAKFVGTPNYVSPEYAAGERVPDFRTDIYSLGATLHHMLTGVLPHAGADPEEILTRLVFRPLPPVRTARRKISPGTSQLVAKMTSPQAHQRPLSWDEVVRDIRRLLGPASAPARPATRAAPQPHPAPPAAGPRQTAARPASVRAPARVATRRPAPARRKAPWLFIAILAAGAGIAAIAITKAVQAEAARAREETARQQAAEAAARNAAERRDIEARMAGIEIVLAENPPDLDRAERRLSALRRDLPRWAASDPELTRRLNRLAAAIQDRRIDAAGERRTLQREQDRKGLEQRLLEARGDGSVQPPIVAPEAPPPADEIPDGF